MAVQRVDGAVNGLQAGGAVQVEEGWLARRNRFRLLQAGQRAAADAQMVAVGVDARQRQVVADVAAAQMPALVQVHRHHAAHLRLPFHIRVSRSYNSTKSVQYQVISLFPFLKIITKLVRPFR